MRLLNERCSLLANLAAAFLRSGGSLIETGILLAICRNWLVCTLTTSYHQDKMSQDIRRMSYEELEELNRLGKAWRERNKATDQPEPTPAQLDLWQAAEESK